MRPSAGKAGVDGKFLVEVYNGMTGTRSLARRFITEAEAQDFYDRTVKVWQMHANREGRSYGVALYETKAAKDPTPEREIARVVVTPLR